MSDNNTGDLASDLPECHFQKATSLLLLCKLLLHLLSQLRLSRVALIELLLGEVLEREGAELGGESPPQTSPAVFGADVGDIGEDRRISQGRPAQKCFRLPGSQWLMPKLYQSLLRISHETRRVEQI